MADLQHRNHSQRQGTGNWTKMHKKWILEKYDLWTDQFPIVLETNFHMSMQLEKNIAIIYRIVVKPLEKYLGKGMANSYKTDKYRQKWYLLPFNSFVSFLQHTYKFQTSVSDC